jgi:glyoxylase-like metal-dependent hydrolase (beta-lactamase superfamily II)
MVRVAMDRLIDVMHLGRDRVIGAYDVDGVVVDPGPASCVETLLEQVRPRVLLLTHIHLDHAGATGVLVRRFPDIQVYVHERGAPHLIDPSKLLASASKLYGDDMDRLWGEVAAVPEENVHALSGGETVEGFRVEYAPGHASHHVVYLNDESGSCFTGDVAGVRVPPSDRAFAPTPPPDIDVEKWRASLDLVERLEPERLCITHFGVVDDVGGQLDQVRRGLSEWGDLARELDRDEFVRRLSAAMHEPGDEIGERLEQAAPPDQLHQGLERYWRKRAERGEKAA